MVLGCSPRQLGGMVCFLRLSIIEKQTCDCIAAAVWVGTALPLSSCIDCPFCSYLFHPNFWISRLAASLPHSTMLFIACDDTKALLVDLTDKTVVRNYALGGTSRYSTAYCPVDHTVVAHQTKSCAFFLSPDTQQPLQRSFTPQSISSCALSSCGSFMIAGSNTGTLMAWGTQSGQLFKNFRAHLRSILCIAISADNSLVVTASEDSVCKVWALASLVSLKTTEVQPTAVFTGHTLGVHCCTFLHHTNLLLTGSADKTCKLFDVTTTQQVHSFTIGDSVTTVAVKEDDASFVAGTKNGYLYFQSIAAPLSDLPHAAQAPDREPIIVEPNPDTHHSAITHLSYSDRNASTVLTVSENGSLLWYDAVTGKLLGEAFPKLKLRILSCCTVPTITGVKKPTRVGLSKNPIDPTTGDFSLTLQQLKT